jgi:hypothetical protein
MEWKGRLRNGRNGRNTHHPTQIQAALARPEFSAKRAGVPNKLLKCAYLYILRNTKIE